MRVDVKGAIISSEDAWIYDFFGMDYVTPKNVTNAIAEARKKNETLDVYINSGGGVVSAGAEIYEELRSYGKVKIHVIQACSAASVIMCAGKSEISPVGMVMIHNVHTKASGDNRDLQHASDVLKTMDRTVAAAYAEKTGTSVENWLELMASETWLTAEQAVNYKLVDEISKPASNGNIPIAVASSEELIPENIVNSMRKKRMRARAQLEYMKLKNGGKN